MKNKFLISSAAGLLALASWGAHYLATQEPAPFANERRGRGLVERIMDNKNYHSAIGVGDADNPHNLSLYCGGSLTDLPCFDLFYEVLHETTISKVEVYNNDSLVLQWSENNPDKRITFKKNSFPSQRLPCTRIAISGIPLVKGMNHMRARIFEEDNNFLQDSSFEITYFPTLEDAIKDANLPVSRETLEKFYKKNCP